MYIDYSVFSWLCSRCVTQEVPEYLVLIKDDFQTIERVSLLIIFVNQS